MAIQWQMAGDRSEVFLLPVGRGGRRTRSRVAVAADCDHGLWPPLVRRTSAGSAFSAGKRCSASR